MVSESVMANLRSLLGDRVIDAGSPRYDEHRAVWNGVIDKRPDLIASPSSTDEVAAIVKVAAEGGGGVSVRGGGHNVAGNALRDGGLVIDLGEMRGVEVDPQNRTVRVQGGARLGDMDTAAQAHGLAVPAGVVSETGVAGLTLGGGVGYMRRKYGLTCDNLLSAEVVTASGAIVTASEKENEDLFWALRGGGGGFGVVTTFEFRAYPLGPEVYVAFVFHPWEQARELFEFFRDFTQSAPEECGLLAFAATTPGHDPFEPEMRNRRTVAFLCVYAGDPSEGERVLAPVLGAAKPLADFSARMPYVEAQAALDEDYPNGMRYYWKGSYVPELTDDAVERLIRLGGDMPSPLSTIDIWHNGGAIRRPKSETAFAHRDAEYMIGLESNWTDASEDKRQIEWTRATYKEIETFSTPGRYLNFPGLPDEQEGVVEAAVGDGYNRLEDVRRKYDPDGLFRK